MSSEKCNCTFCKKNVSYYYPNLTEKVLNDFFKDLKESLERQSKSNNVLGYYCLTAGYKTTDSIPCNNPKCICDKLKIKLEDIK